MSEKSPDEMTPAEWAEEEARIKQELIELKNSGEMNFPKARELNQKLRDHRRQK